MGGRTLVLIPVAILARCGTASAEWAGGEGGNCQSSTVGECLAEAGCRWFSYTGYCQLCDAWFGDQQAGFAGCKRWDPQEYCENVFNAARQKSNASADADVESTSFRDAVGHYRVTQRSGGVGDPHQRTSMCAVWCDSATSPQRCTGKVQAQNALRGVNYGGRFIPEHFLGLPGFNDLFIGIQKAPGAHQLSICDVNSMDAGIRMEEFLARNIKPEQFVAMAQLGFNIVRLPLGYWNLVDLSTSIEGPENVVRRWTQLQNIMPAQQYIRWIDKIFEYAKAVNMMVMMDLHGLPGGQSGNQNTGCDFGWESNFHFGAEHNMQLGLEAVDVMAKICAAKGDVCYGIEVISEPYGPVSHAQEDSTLIMVRKLNSGGLGRHLLAAFYHSAIVTARRHMEKSKPIVLMDWPSWLRHFWIYNANMYSYEEHGRIVFSTHLYEYTKKPITDQAAARKAFRRDMELIQTFSSHTGFDVMISEYALSNHGSGFNKDPFDYNGFTNWFVHESNRRGIGSMVWNYDAYWPAWGPIFKPVVGRTLVDWKGIWSSSSPELLPELYCASCSPPLPKDAPTMNFVRSATSLLLPSKCSAPGQNCTMAQCCSSPGAQCYRKNAVWGACRRACVPGGIDPSERLHDQTPWSCERLGPRALPAPAGGRRPVVRRREAGEEQRPMPSLRGAIEKTMSTASYVFVAVSIGVLAVLGSALVWARSVLPHLRTSKYQTVTTTYTTVVSSTQTTSLCGERCEVWCNELLQDAHFTRSEALQT